VNQDKAIKDRGDGPAFGIKGSRDGLPLIGIFNENARQFPEKQKLPWLVSVSSHFSDMFPNRLPKETEFPSLSQWEDSLIATIENKSQFVWIGHVTWNGFREVFFHIDEPEHVSRSLGKLSGGTHTRPFTFEIDFDEEWERVGVYFKKKMRPTN
jgi:hypothetical protein